MKNRIFHISLQIFLLGAALHQQAVLAATETTPPFLRENFEGGSIPAGWNVRSPGGSTAVWAVVGPGSNPANAPFSGQWQAQFNSYDAARGASSRLTSSAIDLSTSATPFLTFMMYHDQEFPASPDSLFIEVATADSVSGPWQVIGGFQRPGDMTGWKRETLPLIPFGQHSRVFIAFRGVSQYGNNMYVDDVIVADTTFHDLRLSALIASEVSSTPVLRPQEHSRQQSGSEKAAFSYHNEPARSFVFPNPQSVVISACVENMGTFGESTYQIRWQVDGQAQPSANNQHSLGIGDVDTLSLPWTSQLAGRHSIVAWSALASDSNRTNDTLRIFVEVLDSSTIFAELFNGATFPPPGWSVVNRDGGTLPPWFQGNVSSIFLPYEGTGFAADNFQRANGTYLDDYLISPPIAGAGVEQYEDSIRFLVRSPYYLPPAQNYDDSLMILLSTSGTDTSDFSLLLDYFAVPKDAWTPKSYRLSGRVPALSSVRVAFRYLHFNGGVSGSSSDFVGVDFFQFIRRLATNVTTHSTAHSEFTLYQNFPNPFNPSTEISFSVDKPSRATLMLFNVLGEQVATLYDGLARPDEVIRVHWNARTLPSGVYFYTLTSGTGHQTRKLLLMR